MKKTCLFFLLVGLTFAALQVATVAALTGMPGGPGGMPGGPGDMHGGPGGMPGMTGGPGGMPGGPAPDTAPAEDTLLLGPAE